MSRDDGYNPLQWDCERQGCFNRRKRPKIEQFADLLPGKIAFTDVDGLVEIRGNLLFLEWKEHQRLSAGQRILFTRLTRLCPATVLIVEGDAQDMTVESYRRVWEGTISDPVVANLDDLRDEIRQWASWAMANPAFSRSKETVCS